MTLLHKSNWNWYIVHYITLHYITVQYITVHYITLQYISSQQTIKNQIIHYHNIILWCCILWSHFAYHQYLTEIPCLSCNCFLNVVPLTPSTVSLSNNTQIALAYVMSFRAWSNSMPLSLMNKNKRKDQK